MAEAARRSSANTDLFVGSLSASIGLFPTKAEPGREQRFDTAGPNGGVLRYEKRAAPKRVEEQPVEAVPVAPGSSDPLSAEDVEKARQLVAAGDRAQRVLDTVDQMRSPDSGAEGEYVQVLVEDGSGEVVEPEDVRRGVRLEDGRFIDVTDQLAAIVERTKLDRMDVVATIDRTRVRSARVLRAYYVGAQDTASLPVLRLLWEGLREKRAAAIVKYTTRSRQQLGAIVADGTTGTLMLLSLVWAADVREAPEKARSIMGAEVSRAHVEKMTELIGALHGTVEDLDELADDALRLREELRTRAESGEMDASVVEPLPQVEQTSLEDQLAAALADVQAR